MFTCNTLGADPAENGPKTGKILSTCSAEFAKKSWQISHVLPILHAAADLLVVLELRHRLDLLDELVEQRAVVLGHDRLEVPLVLLLLAHRVAVVLVQRVHVLREAGRDLTHARLELLQFLRAREMPMFVLSKSV